MLKLDVLTRILDTGVVVVEVTSTVPGARTAIAAAGYLKHSISGDWLRSTVEEVTAVASGGFGSGCVDR